MQTSKNGKPPSTTFCSTPAARKTSPTASKSWMFKSIVLPRSLWAFSETLYMSCVKPRQPFAETISILTSYRSILHKAWPLNDRLYQGELWKRYPNSGRRESRSIKQCQIAFWPGHPLYAKSNIPDLQADHDNLSRLSYLYTPLHLCSKLYEPQSHSSFSHQRQNE